MDYSVFVLLEKTLKTINHPNFSVRLAPAVSLGYIMFLCSPKELRMSRNLSKFKQGEQSPNRVKHLSNCLKHENKMKITQKYKGDTD